jgi:hypothetical protein
MLLSPKDLPARLLRWIVNNTTGQPVSCKRFTRLICLTSLTPADEKLI